MVADHPDARALAELSQAAAKLDVAGVLDHRTVDRIDRPRILLGITLGDIGFHTGPDEFLLALDEGVLICVPDLSERLSVRPSTVSKMMGRLSERRLVERVAGGFTPGDGADRRGGVRGQGRHPGVHDRIESDVSESLGGDVRPAMRDGLLAAQNSLAARLARLRGAIPAKLNEWLRRTLDFVEDVFMEGCH